MGDRDIQWKRASAARWVELNPVLLQGEPGYEKGTGKFKVGDGVTPWNGLPYKASADLTPEDLEALSAQVLEDIGVSNPNFVTVFQNALSGGQQP